MARGVARPPYARILFLLTAVPFPPIQEIDYKKEKTMMWLVGKRPRTDEIEHLISEKKIIENETRNNRRL